MKFGLSLLMLLTCLCCMTQEKMLTEPPRATGGLMQTPVIDGEIHPDELKYTAGMYGFCGRQRKLEKIMKLIPADARFNIGTDGQMLYATCATASATVAKVAALAAGKLTLKAGATVAVRFTYANNAASPTLNIGGTGAKPIYTQGVRYAYWAAGATVIFAYDGNNWRVASEPVYANIAPIGNPNGFHVYIDGDSVEIRNGDTMLAMFHSNAISFLNNDGFGSSFSGTGMHISGKPVSSEIQDTWFDGSNMMIKYMSSTEGYKYAFSIDPLTGSINFTDPKKRNKPLIAFSDYETALSDESVLINSGARSDLAVTFSKSHDSAPDVILATPFTSTGGGVECAVKNFTSTGFTANMKNGGASAAYFKVCYFAIWL